MPIARVQHVPFWNELSPLTCRYHWDDCGLATLHNSGDGVYLQLQDNQRAPLLLGGPIVGIHHLQHVNFHWGPDNKHGAHHVIGDMPCAMEVHATYYNAGSDFRHPRLLRIARPSWAVVGVRFTEGARNNEFRAVAQSVKSIQEPGTFTELRNEYLSWLKRPRLDRGYLTYVSELPDTTRVTWIIYEEQNTMSKDQVDVFRTLLQNDGTPMIESRCKLAINPLRGEIVFVRDISFLS